MRTIKVLGLLLSVGITLEATAQTPNTGVSGSSSSTPSNQRPSATSNPNQKATNDNPTGRRGGSTDYPAAAYSSGSSQKGSGKMSSGQSRAGNSNLQTGSTKTGDLTNDPNVNSGRQASAPGGSGAIPRSGTSSAGRATRPTRKAHTYTQGSTSNTSQGAASSGAVTNVDQVKTNMSRPSGKTGKEYSGTSNNGSTKRRNASGTGAPATSAATLDRQEGGSGRNNRRSTATGAATGSSNSGNGTAASPASGVSTTGRATSGRATSGQGNYDANKGSTTGPSAAGKNASRYNGSSTKPKAGQTPNQ